MAICSRPISKAEYADYCAAPGSVPGDVEREGALAQAGAGRENHQVGTLETATEQLVDVGKPRDYRREVAGVGAVYGRALLHVGVEHFTYMGEVARASTRANAKQKLFRLAQGHVGVGCALVAYGGNIAAHTNQLPHDGRAAHYLGVVFDVDGGGNGEHQVAQVRGAAYAFEPVPQREFMCHRHLVYGLAPVEQREARLEAPAVLLAVEVGGL